MVIRKFVGILRGKATRGQVFVASLLAGILGFVPGFLLPGDLGGGFLQAPGLILLLFFLVLVLNVNMGIFGLVLVGAKLASLLLLPVQFAIGTFLLDGPLQPLFRSLVNAPVSAWFGLEYYATSGGLVLGAVFGGAIGFMFGKAMQTFRNRMAAVEASSSVYQAHAQSGWARFVGWLLFGKGKGKDVTWQQLAESQRRAGSVRWLGVGTVAVVGAGLWVFQSWFSTPLLTSALGSGLTAANGATVDVDAVELDLAGGGLSIRKLAIADSTALDRDLFAATELTARIDTTALLRKRFVVDQVRATDARSGSQRKVPGKLVEKAPEPPPPPPPADQKTLDDYLRDLELWRGRLRQARDWIELLAGGGEAAEPQAEPTPEEVARRRAEAVELAGYAGAAASHLRTDLPLVLVRAIDIEGMTLEQLPGESIDIKGANLSTDPLLLPKPPTFTVKTRSDKLLAAVSGPAAGGQGTGFELSLKRVPVDSVFGSLKVGGQPPLRGGTLDLAIHGALTATAGAPVHVDLPLQVTLHETTFALAGARETPVERLQLPISVRGPLLRPAIGIDDATLAKALTEAGKQELANFVQAQAGKLLGAQAAPLLEGKTPEQVLDAGKQAAADAAKKAAEDAAKKAAEEAAKKGLTNPLKGLLPGGGDKKK